MLSGFWFEKMPGGAKMPMFERGPIRLRYEERGSGFPVLLIAPGGMRSTIAAWQRTPWNPLDVLADSFRVIAMDQRNAGESTAPVTGADGWATYARDQLDLLDHLGVDRCHVVGMCIGGPYSFELIRQAPHRIASAVLLQPIGRSAENGGAFRQLFDGWAEHLRATHPDVTDEDWGAFRENMFGGEFLFNVSRDYVRDCDKPLLVLMGNDLYHPEETSRDIAALAPHATLIERWKEGADRDVAIRRVRDFLSDHSP
jgi:pimeloyl-ACP methyl ester carboxylesterase